MTRNSLPLDEVNRDWTKGNCYFIALEFMKDSNGLAEEGAFGGSAKVNLVHGLIRQIESDQTSKMIRHAWVEINDEKVIDGSNGNSGWDELADYYSRKEAKKIRSFSRVEADAIVSTQEQIGYWGDYTDELVMACVAKYDPSNSYFSQEAVFSKQIACEASEGSNPKPANEGA